MITTQGVQTQMEVLPVNVKKVGKLMMRERHVQVIVLIYLKGIQTPINFLCVHEVWCGGVDGYKTKI